MAFNPAQIKAITELSRGLFQEYDQIIKAAVDTAVTGALESIKAQVQETRAELSAASLAASQTMESLNKTRDDCRKFVDDTQATQEEHKRAIIEAASSAQGAISNLQAQFSTVEGVH